MQKDHPHRRGFAPKRPDDPEIMRAIAHLHDIAGTKETTRITRALASNQTNDLLDEAWQIILKSDAASRRVVLRAINQRMRRGQKPLVTIQIPPDVHAELKKYADKNGLSLSQAFMRLLGEE